MNLVISTLFLILMGLALLWDVRSRRIPNRLTLTGIALGLGLRTAVGLDPLLGGLAGFGVAALAGLPLLALGGIGGGDFKLLLVVGGFLGPGAFFTALLAAGIAGGVLGVAVAVARGVLLPVLVRTRKLAVHLLTLGRRGERVSLDSPGAVTVPYGAAIAVGAAFAWLRSFGAGGLL